MSQCSVNQLCTGQLVRTFLSICFLDIIATYLFLISFGTVGLCEEGIHAWLPFAKKHTIVLFCNGNVQYQSPNEA